MTLNKLQAYLFLQGLVILLCLLYESVWLFSSSTPAEITGYGKALGRRGRQRPKLPRACPAPG